MRSSSDNEVFHFYIAQYAPVRFY